MPSVNELTLEEIAQHTGSRLSGNPEEVIKGANTIENATKGEITFLGNPKYKKWMHKTDASCIIVPPDCNPGKDKNSLISENPSETFRQVLAKIYGKKTHPVKGISPRAKVSEKAVIGKNVRIGDNAVVEAEANIGDETILYPGVYIGEKSTVGRECVLFPGVSVMDSTKIGNGVVINAGTVIGGEGFGFAMQEGKHVKIPQVGGVVIEDNVEIGANVTIDRGSPGNTVIGEGTKIDNLVQIAHNVKIGKNCILVAQVGIAGSTVIEDSVLLAGQVGVVGHIKIGEGAQVGAQAGVTRSIKPGQQVSGYPALEHRQANRIHALTRRLPRLFKDMEKIKKKLERDE